MGMGLRRSISWPVERDIHTQYGVPAGVLFWKMASLSQEDIVAQLRLWKESVLANVPKAKLVRSALSVWSPWEYLLGLDGITRFSVILALIVCSYILFASMWRFSRMLMSFAVFVVQLVLVFLVVAITLQYRDGVTAWVQQAAAKLEL